MFFINGVIPQKTTPRNNLWQNVLYVKKMSVTIVPAPLLGISLLLYHLTDNGQKIFRYLYIFRLKLCSKNLYVHPPFCL